ncbi:MAG: Methylmalonyl-CoA mutase [Gemmatimonadetes bacterium]|nr:Methylmalonyl-CoA mutase [Gemmatimonadota bacterium]
MSVIEPDTAPAELLERIAEKERELESLRGSLADWQGRYARTPKRDPTRGDPERGADPADDGPFTSVSGHEVRALYTPLDRPEPSAGEAEYYNEKVGAPGEYPFTRGPYGSMYRTRLWTMRQFAGFGTAEETNQRYHFLLERGQTGLSVAFDFPTLMGYDSDHPRSLGEVGKCGVAISSLDDMETLFDGIPLDQVSVSMTINGPAIILFCFYMIAAEKQGVPFHKLRGTVQNDILKEYQAQHAWVYPPEPALRLVIDMFEWAAGNAPKYNPVSISGYHIREAGSTAAQELAYTLRNGFEYVERGIARGLDVDDFAPRLSFFWDVHNDFFEEIAKFRAARRMWARLMKDRYGAKDPKSWMLRTHAQTAGVSLTAQQPYNNIVRVAIQALAAVMGGTQSLHTNSMDETLALPTDESVMIALRTQQVIAEESGVTNVVDPFGGSYFMEALTNKVEREALDYIRRIDEMGGIVKAIENGFPQAEIGNSAYHFQRQLESKDKVMVGVNKYQAEESARKMDTLYIDRSVEKRQIDKLTELKRTRDAKAHAAGLQGVKTAAENGQNLMEPIITAVKAYATLQEVCDTLRGIFGVYRDTGSF